MSEQNQAVQLAGSAPLNASPAQSKQDVLAALTELKQQVAAALERAVAAREAIPALPDGVGNGDADTIILILLELRTMSTDAEKAAAARAGIQRMAARAAAQAAFASGPQLEYGKLERELRLKAQKLGVSPY